MGNWINWGLTGGASCPSPAGEGWLAKRDGVRRGPGTIFCRVRIVRTGSPPPSVTRKARATFLQQEEDKRPAGAESPRQIPISPQYALMDLPESYYTRFWRICKAAPRFFPGKRPERNPPRPNCYAFWENTCLPPRKVAQTCTSLMASSPISKRFLSRITKSARYPGFIRPFIPSSKLASAPRMV